MNDIDNPVGSSVIGAALGVPFGWFQVGWPADVAAGSVLPLEYFGRRLVLWRDETDVVHLNWTSTETREFHVGAAWQEMAENGADGAHFGFVHGQSVVPTIDAFETDGPIIRMRSTQRWPTPDGVVEAFVEATSYGPGFSVVRMTGIIDTISLGCNTPVTEDRCHLRFTFGVKELGDPATTSMVGDGFISLLTEQIGEDVTIWEHKTYLPRPALSAEDGPIMQFRAWARQFYAPSG